MKDSFKASLFLIAFFAVGCLLVSCSREAGKKSRSTLFTLLDSAETGTAFVNHLDYSEQLRKKFNIYTFRNFYNGGGVALGDMNNDGLPDIFMVANMGTDVLYLNKGD